MAVSHVLMRLAPIALGAALAAGSPAAAEAPPPGGAMTEAPAPASPAPAEDALRGLIRTAAAANGVPSELAEAVAEVESGFNPKAVGGVGEIGLMQVLPSTARMLGFRAALPELFDPETNVRYGVRYLGEAWRKTGNDICGTVMKYRAGHGETRFSRLSVAYCVRVRAILAARGFAVTGEVPVATFGATAGASPAGARRLANGRVRMRFNWRAVDSRRKALDRAGSASLGLIAR
ncbi:soluble lytic murein transglycosylase-like protein [Methylopila capsulata]|uniref:Soluble lytic murein transglycosylase-like protein n=1 Tax=Methylopila capsulata TaxID=61654 RepID=A0ABS2T6U4_9HYPH|nr:transglycosylase SLT domain-containing protein [Methylopila capsulata]MBM7851595.1 soluble lytic murein transglycosylase-like protein [Methylopila capsulata]